MNEGGDAAHDAPVLYESRGRIGLITMNRPAYHNAQNGRMTYALDDAFRRAAHDDAIGAIVLRGNGKHFSAGHDIGTPGYDTLKAQSRVSLWYDHSDKPGAELLYVREQEAFLGMCRRWREIPKPTIAMVHGACIAGGLMLAWVCDLIVASDDAFFSDPVLKMGLPGVEYFAHPFEMAPRIAKEFLFLGDRMTAQRAYDVGMVNRVVPRDRLEADTLAIAERIAAQPRLALVLAKQAINLAEDAAGKRLTIDSAFAMHHLGHAHAKLTTGNHISGQDAKSMKESAKP